MKRFFLIFLLLSCVVLLSGALLLKKGIHVNEFSVEGVLLSNISFQWNTRLDMVVENFTIEMQQDDEPNRQFFDPHSINKAVSLLGWAESLFAKITIENISVGDIKGNFSYEGSSAKLNLSSELITFSATVRKDANVLIADIQQLKSEQFNSRATGNIHFDLNSKRGEGTFDINLAESLPLALSVNMDQNQLSFEGKEAGIITKITPFVDLFELDPSIQKWITDYLSGTRYNLKSFAGHFPWEDPMAIAETFVAEIRIDGCQYIFAPGFEAIQSDYTDLFFKKGVLTILPHETRFYGNDGQDSWLDINFNDPDNILLTTHIRTLAQAGQEVVDLLQTYGIPLPFLQSEGKTSVELLLSINLNTELVQADGTFLIDEGRVVFHGDTFIVEDLHLELDTDIITIEHLQVSFGQLFSVDVTGVFDATAEIGNFDIILQETAIELGNSKLTLNRSKKNPTLNFSTTPASTTVTATESFWYLGGFPLNIGAFSAPIYRDTLSGVISSTPISYLPFVSSETYGTFSLKEQSLNLKSDFKQCQIKDLKLQKSVDDVSILYDKGLTIQTSEESYWTLGVIPVTLYPSEFRISDTLISVTRGRASFGDFFDATFTGYFDNLLQRGEFVLKDLEIKDEDVGQLLSSPKAISIKVERHQETLLVKIPEFAVNFSISEKDKSWILQLDDLSALYEHSPLLQQYLLKDGRLAVASQEDGGYHLSADIPYDYSLLLKDGVPQTDYHISGEFHENILRATVNQDMEIVYDNGIMISSRDLSFNIPAIKQLLKDLPEAVASHSEDEFTMDVQLDSKRTNLFFKEDMQVLADDLNLKYSDGKTTLELQHGEGAISCDVEGKYFSLTGKGLNNVFMNGLLAGMDFHKGSMKFAAKGSFEEFTAMVKIEDTVLKDFKTLNNVLAMVNTIPALVTFNLPSYSTEGLAVKDLVAGMKVKNGIATFETLGLDSSEMRIAGNGWIDFINEEIAMDLNLITRAKDNMTKIPLIGYILVGKKKSPSITVKMTGDLLDPKVENSTFQEVVTVPFQMLFRTLALPAYLVTPIFDMVNEDVEVEEERDGEVIAPYEK